MSYQGAVVSRSSLVGAFLLFSVRCSPSWDTVTPVDGDYSVKTPSLFVMARRLPVKTALGSVDYSLVGSDTTRFKQSWPIWSGRGPYVVAHADFPLERYREAEMARLFDGERNRLLGQAERSGAQGGSPSINLDKAFSLGGSPGGEVVVRFADGTPVQARMYFVRGRFYVLYGMGKKLDAFFGSINVLG